ncbi:MAG: winged helix-turn-helix domain-containing protein [Candidatus Aegiribacteria sp.]|nr:winged helix-turn-helix domain-containing protein [Candidatus Aegiribacteria sp.]
MSTKSIDESLFGRIRRELLQLFFLNPGRSFFLLELVDILRTGRGGVQRELSNLVESGIITREKSGMKVLFSLSESCPITDEMQKLLVKLVDYEDMLSLAVSDHATFIKTAAMYSPQEGEYSPSLKLLVSCDDSCEEFLKEIKRIELLIGRKIELMIVRTYELKEYIRSRTEAQWILNGTWTLLAGTEKDLEPEQIRKESVISEPDLFSGTDFSW